MRLTRIHICEGSRMFKITIILITSHCLIVHVHGISCMGPNCIWIKTHPSFLDRPTVQAQSTNIINISLQSILINPWFGQAPSFSINWLWSWTWADWWNRWAWALIWAWVRRNRWSTLPEPSPQTNQELA